MKYITTTHIIFFPGIFSILLALFFGNKIDLEDNLFFTIFLSIGASLIAAAFVHWHLSRNISGIPIHSIIEALARKTEFMRLEQSVELILLLDKDNNTPSLRLEKRHKYKLHNPTKANRIKKIEMFTDSSGLNKNGFCLVIGPSGNQLNGDELQNHIHLINGKYLFKKSYSLVPGSNNQFEFRSAEKYRLTDRLIWTVQDLSNDFKVRIINLNSG